MLVWLEFIACTLVITFAGAKLSKYGDVIAEKTGLGRTWIGIVLMASVTSLPELITGISSVAAFDLPDIAVGDVLGSCMFNILIIALLDFIGGDEPILSQGAQGQTLTAAFTVLLISVAAVSMAASAVMPRSAWFGLSSLVILAAYCGAMRLIFKFQREDQSHSAERHDLQYGDISKTRAFTIYGMNAVLVIAAATWLPQLGERIAEMTGLGQSFVGSLFIALATSLPEFVVTYSALRLGAVNLALGNLIGSNLFNIAVLAIDDLAYTKGPLLAQVGGEHIVTAVGAILMTALVLIGLTYRARGKHFGFGWDSVLIIIVFATGTWISYLAGGASR